MATGDLTKDKRREILLAEGETPTFKALRKKLQPGERLNLRVRKGKADPVWIAIKWEDHLIKQLELNEKHEIEILGYYGYTG